MSTGRVGGLLLLVTLFRAYETADATPPPSPSPPANHLRRALALDPVDVGVLFGTPEGKRSLQQLETAPAIAAGAALVLGAALCAAGARFDKHATLGCAFLDGAVAVSLALDALHVVTLPSAGDWASAASWVSFFLGGVLLAVVVLAHDALGRFVLGGTAGAMLALVCQSAFGFRLEPAHPASLAKYRVADASAPQYALPGERWGYLAATVACCALGCLTQQLCTLTTARRRPPRGDFVYVESPR
ncbi:hypothetical protein PybrP1_012014 [[Pythium] brassicae (nom. inval.)]|nr:hypothetical protein PybrP1_012014 [[Pythium] brassicae (nom. inval.)]